MNYRVQVEISEELYEQFKEFMKGHGVHSWGRYSKIGGVNSAIFIDAVNRILSGKDDIKNYLT